MSHVRKGMLTASKEWAVHLRPYWKRQFWGQHRAAERDEARNQLEEAMPEPTENTNDPDPDLTDTEISLLRHLADVERGLPSRGVLAVDQLEIDAAYHRLEELGFIKRKKNA